jgi:hypothetical protein
VEPYFLHRADGEEGPSGANASSEVTSHSGLACAGLSCRTSPMHVQCKQRLLSRGSGSERQLQQKAVDD